MLKMIPITNRAAWHSALHSLPTAHILQSWEWGDFKHQETGWQPERLAFEQESIIAAASLLTRQVGPLRVIYVSKGPALDYSNPAHVDQVLETLERLARQRRAIWIKIDPDVIAGTGIPGSAEHPAQDDPTGQRVISQLRARGWRFSASQVQFRNTITLDLSRDEEAILAAMNQSTRRKVRTGPKKGVTVRLADSAADFQTLYDLYRVTGARQGFLIRPPDYYHTAWSRFMEAGLAAGFLAEWEGRALAGLVLFHFGPKAWYFYGMSANEERERMPTYQLQWEAMRWAKAQGYATYDFWGAPNEFVEEDPMWGVFRFKEGFGGTVVRHIGAWDYAPNPALYWAYERLMPRVIALMRRRAAPNQPPPNHS
ncbi:MAG: peptidoglycan bridge formation glycyltransferase FemA/FemB family protein [Chloroflexi bacterium]|nr:peptidoglycan bridge formation glycyltransferase FemA/FemB family protein [Chloroflexota bacterium]